MKKTKILLSAIILMFISCKKETVYQTGNMVGFVTLYDEVGHLIEDKSGVNISIEGSSKYNGITNTNGKFEIDNIQSGTYNIIFTKQGFAETKQIGYRFIGGSNPVILTQVITKPSSTTVNIVNVTYDTTQYIVRAKFKLNYLGAIGSFGFVRFFCGLSDTISYTNYDFTSGYGFEKTATNDTITHNISITSIIQNNNYPSGSKVYFIAYGEPSITGTTYVDENTGKTIYPGLNPNASKIMSAIIP